MTYKSVSEFFDVIFCQTKPVLQSAGSGSHYALTGPQIIEACDQIAGLLAQNSVAFGDRVVAVLDNNIETALLILAAMRHGICLCVQPAGTSIATLKDLADQHSATAIIDTTQAQDQDAIPLSIQDLARYSPHTAPDIPEGTPFLITFTSGSTGKPKGVLHSARSFLACGQDFNTQSGITATDRFLNVMPMYYMAGIFNGILAPLNAGACVVICDAFSTATALRFWPIIAEHHITALWVSPTMLSLITKLDRSDKTIPPTLRHVFVGTGALSAADAQTFFKTYGLTPKQSYGLSEILYVSVSTGEPDQFGTVGTLLPTVQVAKDPDTGTFQFSSPNYSFLGYVIEGVYHAHTGPFQTSDLGQMTDAGVLSITGRADDLIIRGGVNVDPIALENHLAPLLEQGQFCILGLPAPDLGQKVVLVTKNTEVSSDLFAKLQSEIRNRFTRVQLDDKRKVDEFPTGPTGKTQRSALRDHLMQASKS